MSKSNKKFVYLRYFAAGQSDSQVGTLVSLFPTVLSILKTCCNIRHGFYRIGPTLQFPNVNDTRISLSTPDVVLTMERPLTTNLIFTNRLKVSPSARKHMARPRCFPSENYSLRFYNIISEELLFDLNIAPVGLRCAVEITSTEIELN